MTDERVEAGESNPLPKCDHTCLLDADHVERGERHFYGYENPSPRAHAVEEPGAGFACRLCGCSFTTEALRSMHEVNTCVHDRPAPAGTECPTCGGNGEFLDALAKGADRYVPCSTCSPNETSEQ